MKKQTAIEWLEDKINDELEIYNNQWLLIENFIEQAKIIEKQQNSYSDEEVMEIIRQYALEEHLITSSKPDIWFKQFKKTL